MKVEVNETEKAVVIKLHGEMMLGYEANDFHEAIRSSIEKNKKKIVVDLSEVKFISSWGVGILIFGYTTATNAGCKFSLASVPDKITETFRKIKIDTIFQQYNSVADAIK